MHYLWQPGNSQLLTSSLMISQWDWMISEPGSNNQDLLQVQAGITVQHYKALEYMFFVWHLTLWVSSKLQWQKGAWQQCSRNQGEHVFVSICVVNVASMQHPSTSSQMVALSDVINLHFSPVLRRWVESTQILSHSSLSRFAEAHHHANTHAGEDSRYPPESKCHFSKCPLKSTYVQVLCRNTRRPP